MSTVLTGTMQLFVRVTMYWWIGLPFQARTVFFSSLATHLYDMTVYLHHYRENKNGCTNIAGECIVTR
jgi:hypothetical protein